MEFDIPPLNCLPAFEAAARHRSFTDAADELCRTQAAISFQVRKLEKNLSVKLFLRRHRSLELTEEGQALFGAVQSTFKILATEKALITGDKPQNAIAVSAPVSFCSKWLIPRLSKLHNTAPRMNLLIDATDDLVDFQRNRTQIAIRYCATPPEGFVAKQLIEDVVFPVCSPHLIAAQGRNLELSDLYNLTLLRDQMTDYIWSEWLSAVGAPVNLKSKVIRFSHTGNAIDAAIAGQGIAFGRLPLVADDIEAGRLVRPFQSVGRSEYAYYLLRSPTSINNPIAEAVATWLMSEADETAQSISPAKRL